MKQLSAKKVIELIENRRNEYFRLSEILIRSGNDALACEMRIRADEDDCVLIQLKNDGKSSRKFTVPKGVKVTTIGLVSAAPHKS